MPRKGHERRFEFLLDPEDHADLIAFIDDERARGRKVRDVMIDALDHAVHGPPPDAVKETLADALNTLADKINALARPEPAPPVALPTESAGIDMSRPRPRKGNASARIAPDVTAEPSFDEEASRRLLLSSIRGFGEQKH
jgi:hypothetical protein